MNTELKALIKLAIDGIEIGEDFIKKESFSTVILPALYPMAADVPAAFSNFSDLKAEITALPGSAQEQDLIAYVISQLPQVTTNAQAAAIVAAALDLVTSTVEKSITLANTIKAAKAA